MACSSEVTVSAATIGPTRASPIITDATPIAYFELKNVVFGETHTKTPLSLSWKQET